MLEARLIDFAVVGGVDTLCLTTLYGFASLQLLSAAPCRPYDVDRDGISIGEAAVFFLLERTTRAGSIALLGAGESSDAHHMSAPHPEGQGARRAMELALGAAGLAPEAIDYVNLHGTGTPSNDAAEDVAVHGLFGDSVPVNSTKGMTGHALGAAGALEALLSVIAIEEGRIPGSPGTRVVDPKLRACYEMRGAVRNVQRVLSNSFGFGGSNCSLVFGRDDGQWHSRLASRASVSWGPDSRAGPMHATCFADARGTSARERASLCRTRFPPSSAAARERRSAFRWRLASRRPLLPGAPRATWVLCSRRPRATARTCTRSARCSRRTIA